MSATTPNPHGHETLTAADAWFLMTRESPTPEQEHMLDAVLHKMYVADFGEDPPQSTIYPDTPRPDPAT